MHHNQSGLYTNNLSSHASLLLSASPTIITSPSQNNSNGDPLDTSLPSSIAHIRRQSSAVLLTTSNLDNDSQANIDSPTNNIPTEGYINFKKPQNEMFKKLDGKIQKIVAAHSNLNKLYALNDFSSLGAGPKRPFELPPQLPPPPPWVPKVGADFACSWNDESNSFHGEISNSDSSNTTPNPGSLKPNNMNRLRVEHHGNNLLAIARSSSLTIDSAISRLHQRRKLNQSTDTLEGPGGPSPSSSSSNSQAPTITPAQFTLLAQKIKETLETECSAKNRGGNLSIEDKKKFQSNLIALLKEEITNVTKTAKIRFTAPPSSKQVEQRSILMKSSPQSLYDTIRRETSILLSKRDQTGRSSLSLLSDRPNLSTNLPRHDVITNSRQSVNKLHQTIKVIVPPTEFHSIPKSDHRKASENVSQRSRCIVDHDAKPLLTYQLIKNKIRLFQESYQTQLCGSQILPLSTSGLKSALKRKKTSQKSIEKIVDRLQAKRSPSPAHTGPLQVDKKPVSLQQQIIYSSASLLQSSRNISAISAPTPIPVFRSPLTPSTKGAYLYPSSSATSKIVNVRSKKSKRLCQLGLRIGNYLEKECPQPTAEKINIEQFAKCLNLVRTNDISLQRRQQQLMHTGSRCRIPISGRPLRLRRLRGERIHMPASASYKATRKVGLQ